MPEFPTSKQRRQKSRADNQNNKQVSKHAGHQPQTFQTAMLPYQIPVDAETGESKTIDINGNVHLSSLPTHEPGTNIARSDVQSSRSTESPCQEDNVASSIQPHSRRGSDCSMMSIRSSSLADVCDIQDNAGIEESCPSAKLSASGFPKTTTNDQPITTTSREPPVNNSFARRPSSVPGPNQRRPWLRSSSCQRKPANCSNDGKTVHSDFSKRQGNHANLKTGTSNKRHSVPGTRPFPAAPCFNAPMGHMFHPNPFPYGTQMPPVNLTEHQRQQIWNSFARDRHNLFPQLQLACGANQVGKQFQDKNYGYAFKQKYPRNSGQDQQGKTNRFQNRFRSRKPVTEGAGMNKPQCKDIKQTEKDVQQNKPITATYLPDSRSKETAQNLHNNDCACIISEAVKRALSSSNGEQTGNQMRHSEHKDTHSQRGRSTVADMERIFQKALQLDRKNTDSEAREASQLVQRQTRTDVVPSREYPNEPRTNPTFPAYANGMLDCTSACVPGKAHTWSHGEYFHAQSKPNMPPCSLQDQAKASSHNLGRSDEFVPANSISVSNKYSAIPSMPLKFDPTVHPLQVFQNRQVEEYNHHCLRQGTGKRFPTCTPVAGMTPQNAHVSEGCSSTGAGFHKEVSNHDKENQVPLNATASTNTARDIGRYNTNYNVNSYSMPSRDSLSTVNPSHFEDIALVASGSHTDNGALRLTINEEIEEEMRRAQCMSIPVKHNSERFASLQSRLNPNADEFSPPLSDSSGNLFTMTKQNGVCYFKRDSGNSIVSHQESNTSYEHEVTEVLISTSDNILKNYPNDNYHFIPKESRNKFFPAHEQQECRGSDYLFYSGFCTPSSDISCFSTSHAYNTLTPYITAHTPEPALSTNNQMHPFENHFAPGTYYNETCTPYFTPAHSQANQVLPPPEIQMHPQHPYTSPGYTLCSLMPMYVTPSPAATPVMQYSGTEYCPVLMQAPVGPGVPFTVPAPAHMPAQTQPSMYSGSEPTPMTCPTQNYTFQAPVFNLQAYHEATHNLSVDHHTSGHSDLKRDHPNAVMTQNNAYYANDGDTKWQENIHSKTTQNQNMDSKVCAETCQIQLNSAQSVTPNMHQSNRKSDNAETASENKSSVISESDVLVARDIRKTPEFEECKILLERLRNREFSLNKCRQSVSSEPETHRHIEKWLEVAGEIIKGSANQLTIDEMALLMLVPSLRKKICIKS